MKAVLFSTVTCILSIEAVGILPIFIQFGAQGQSASAVDLPSDATIQDLQQSVKTLFGLDESDYSLIYGGEPIRGDSTLADFGISAEAVVHVQPNGIPVQFRFTRQWSTKSDQKPQPGTSYTTHYGEYGHGNVVDYSVWHTENEVSTTCFLDVESGNFFADTTECLLRKGLIKVTDSIEFSLETDAEQGLTPGFQLSEDMVAILSEIPAQTSDISRTDTLIENAKEASHVQVGGAYQSVNHQIISSECTLIHLQNWYPGQPIIIKSPLKGSDSLVYQIYYNIPAHLTLKFQRHAEGRSRVIARSRR